MKIVLDTNVFISGIFWKGPPRRILDLWASHKVEIIITKSILAEYARVLKRFDPGGTVARRWETFSVENSQIVEEKVHLKLCRDPDDDKFLSCALLGNTDYLVSGDDDLLSLKTIGASKIVTAKEFLKLFPY